MASVDELQSEHERLRQALLAVREALSVAEIPQVVQGKLRTLIELLSGHIQREHTVLTPYANRLQALLKQEAEHDHVEPQVALRDLDVLCSAWRIAPTETVMLHVVRLLEELRERLDEEERDIFPVVRHAETTKSPRVARRAALDRPRRRPQCTFVN